MKHFEWPTMQNDALEGKVTEKMCPSGRCREGTILLGIVGANGVLGYVEPVMRIDTEFVERAQQGRNPEARFRFAEPCVEQKCAQWAGCRCGVIEQVLQSREGARIVREASGPLPSCVIRSSCRWFAQTGPQACAVCPHVVHTPESMEAGPGNQP